MKRKKIITLIATLGLITCLHTRVNAFIFYDTVGTRYEGAVERLGELGIINGVSDKTFSANKKVTRAEFAKMIIEIMYSKEDIELLSFKENEHKFDDVPSDKWYTKYVQIAIDLGLLNGYEDHTFRPDNDITYEQVSKILTKVLGHKYLVETDPNGWSTEYVKKMYELKLHEGCAPFKKTDKATRGNIAIMLWNTLTNNVWDYVWLNEKEGFTYMPSTETLFDRRVKGYIYMENIKISDFKEINDKLHVKIGSTYYKLYDDEAKITFSMLGGKTDALFRLVRYPDDEYSYEIIGISTDTGATLYSGTLTQLREDGFDIRNNVTKVGTSSDYGFFIDNEDSYDQDRIVTLSSFNKRLYVEDVKIETKKGKVIQEEENIKKKILAQNTLEYTYYPEWTPSTKTITVNKDYVINDGALLFKNNVNIDWNSLKKGDVLTEIVKDRYYFVSSSNTIEVKIEDLKKESNLFEFVTNKGRFEAYGNATYLGYFDDLTTSLKYLKSNDLNNLKNKNAKLILDFAGRVVRIEVLQGDLSSDLLDLGIVYYSNDYFKQDEKKEKHFITVKTNFKTKRYEMSNSELIANPGDLLKVELDSENKEYLKSVSLLSNNAKINEKLNFKKTTYDELAKMKALGQIADDVLICESKYFYEFGKYETPEDFELKVITLENLKYVNIEKSEFYMVYDTEDLVRVIFVKDYSEKRDIFYGKVERIFKEKGSESLKIEIDVLGKKKMVFSPSGLLNCEEGDLISFKMPKNDIIQVVEKFSTNVLGYYRDLIVKTANRDKTIVALNGAVNLKEQYITSGGRRYNLNNYTIILINISKNEKGIWQISSADAHKPDDLVLKAGDRIAIEEIEDTIIVYRGYKD